MCLCVCVCVIPNVFDLDCMCQTSVDLMPYCIKHTSRSSGTKEPRIDMCRLILSLSKIADQMWCDHPFS